MDKKNSTSTDVEPVHKDTNPLQKGKRELDNMEIKEKRKKQKKEKTDKKEVKDFRKSVKEVNEIMKELKDIMKSKAHLPVISFGKEEEEGPVEPINECNFRSKDHLININRSLFVRGFDTCRPRQEIKRALWKHFESCGKVKRVYVPIECDTGSCLGFAFIEMEEGCTMVYILDGSHLEGQELQVEFAKYRDESFDLGDFIGCERCINYMPWLGRHRYKRYVHVPLPSRTWRTVGTPFSKIGRFTSNIARVFN